MYRALANHLTLQEELTLTPLKWAGDCFAGAQGASPKKGDSSDFDPLPCIELSHAITCHC